MMKQKFRKFTFVHVWHFDSGFDAIVEGTHSQIYGGKDVDSYAVYKLKDNKIEYQISWYTEQCLRELKNQDRCKAEEMVEVYNFKREKCDE